jgi:hypothetical protein
VSDRRTIKGYALVLNNANQAVQTCWGPTDFQGLWTAANGGANTWDGKAADGSSNFLAAVA